MASLIPIPTTRVGDYFIRQRLVRQVQGDQLDLFRLQSQVSTGRRIIRPSEDAPAALRAISLQRTIQRKDQAARNLASSRSVLGAAETSLNTVSDELNRVRSEALGAVSNLTSEESRSAAIAAIDAALGSLINSGNANYTGRYLFGGSRTGIAPFEQIDQFVKYIGNEKNLQNYVDLEQLFTTNIPGTEVFGGISGEVRGTADLNPHLTADTLLTSINGGEGLDTNAAIAVNITTGGNTTPSIIDLSGTVTVGDVIRRIEAGANVTVDIADNGLTVRTVNGADTVRVSEVAAGRAAAELGILTPAAAPASDTMAGSDLDPIVRKTTPLVNLFGTKASVRVNPTGSNNELVITAATNGTAFNNVTVDFVNDVASGNESATYVPGLLTVHIASDTTAADVAQVINNEGTFTAELGARDATSSAAAGTGTVVDFTFPNLTSGGSGENLDTASGLILTNGGESVTLDVSSAETVEDLLNLIAGAEIGMVAAINAEGTGINVRSQLSGADFTIGENGGTTATQLGIRTYTGETLLADLNRGLGVPTNDLQDDTVQPITADDLVITARDLTVITVDLDTATTLADVVTLINAAAGATPVVASLTADGHGIQLVDSSVGAGDLTISNSQAAEDLGFVSAGQQIIDDGDGILRGYRHSGEDDFVVVARDGTELWIDATGATSVQDVMDLINNHSRNNEGTTAVEARLATVGNGIELVDTSAPITDDLIVRAGDSSQTAQYLGFMPLDQTEARSNMGSGGGDYTLTSEDRNTIEVDSVFNSLLRLRQALESDDEVAIGRAIERLDVDLDRVVFARGEIGSRLQSLDVVETRLEDENVQLQGALSNEIDVDLVDAISNLTARQYALQASLQTAANILNLSILDYI